MARDYITFTAHALRTLLMASGNNMELTGRHSAGTRYESEDKPWYGSAQMQRTVDTEHISAGTISGEVVVSFTLLGITEHQKTSYYRVTGARMMITT